jgi:hypothetical protein
VILSFLEWVISIYETQQTRFLPREVGDVTVTKKVGCGFFYSKGGEKREAGGGGGVKVHKEVGKVRQVLPADPQGSFTPSYVR